MKEHQANADDATKLWLWTCYGCLHDGLVHGRTAEGARTFAAKDHRQVSLTCGTMAADLTLLMRRPFVVEPVP